MGERGPAPAPTNIRKLRGDRPDRINDNEPKPMPRSRPPSCPPDLKGEARREWRRRAPELHRKGLLTDWDLPLFRRWCELVHIAYQAYAEWAADEFAVTIESYRGQRVRHPALQSLRDATSAMLPISKRFGFTPSDRAGIEMPKIPPERARELMTPRRIRGEAPAG